MNRFATALLIAALATALVPTGCGPPPVDRLVVATSWPSVDRRRIEAEFARWLARSGKHGRETVRLDWLLLARGDDLAHLAGRRNPPDLLLGGSAASFDRLAGMDQLAPLPLEGSPSWSVVRRSRIRLVGPSSRSGSPDAIRPSTDPIVAIDDPRDDPISLAWARELVGGGHFRDGYSRLIRVAGHRRRIGRQAGEARAAVERGEADLAPEAVVERPDGDLASGPPWIEGAAILRATPRPEQAGFFLRFLAETGPVGPAPPSSGKSTDAEALLADLLGATLVDAQDELWSAWEALDRRGDPEHALRSLNEPPPWPPASVAKMMTRGGERGMSMVETLAGELATEPSARAWLVRSWLAPHRLIDDAMLEELARAADGRLFREPRFRDWLRAEWTAWARQRYRRVARLLPVGLVIGDWVVGANVSVR